MRTVRKTVRWLRRNIDKDDLKFLAEGFGFVFSMASILICINVLYLITK